MRRPQRRLSREARIDSSRLSRIERGLALPSQGSLFMPDQPFARLGILLNLPAARVLVRDMPGEYWALLERPLCDHGHRQRLARGLEERR
jgi:hypothetical protein